MTQQELADELGLDVSSVNKILNRSTSGTFRKDTVKRVFTLARKKGYDFKRVTKGNMTALASRLALAAKDVMELLQRDGAKIVPHLLDTDENAGQRLRDVLEEAIRAGVLR